MLTSEQFDRTRRLALTLAGIELFERHRDLIHWRCCRSGPLDSAGYDALLRAAEDGDRDASRRLVCLITTGFTGFFRHPAHFTAAAGHAVQAVARHGHARLWSAGASTGEEPYSLAMALLETVGRDDPPVTILATDISEEGLSVARRAEYGEAALASLSPGRHARFFSEAANAGRLRLAPEVRRLVEFRTLNLVDACWGDMKPYDVIFCRNVLMYLEAAHRSSVLRGMADLLRPDGMLILDPVEHPGSVAHLFSGGKNGVYSLRPQSGTATHSKNTEP